MVPVRMFLLLTCLVGGASGFVCRTSPGARQVVSSPLVRPLAAHGEHGYHRRELLSGAALVLGLPGLPRVAFGVNGDAEDEAARRQADETRKMALVSARPTTRVHTRPPTPAIHVNADPHPPSLSPHLPSPTIHTNKALPQSQQQSLHHRLHSHVLSFLQQGQKDRGL